MWQARPTPPRCRFSTTSLAYPRLAKGRSINGGPFQFKTMANAYKTKWTAEKRRDLASWQFAGTDGESFPISDQSDVDNAWNLRGHDDDPKKTGENVLRIAARLGLKPPSGDDKDKPATKSETVVASGSSIKSDPENEWAIKGYLVVFTDPTDPDAETDVQRQFFTAKTDYGTAKESDLYYTHGLNRYIKTDRIGHGSMKADEIGVFFDGELDKRYKYASKIKQLRDKGALGLSSGTASHLVRIKEITDGHGTVVAEEILQWPLGVDASVTPTPAEPRTYVMRVKAWQEAFKSVLPMQDAQFSQDEALGEPFKYDETPRIGHTMCSKLAAEHSAMSTQLYARGAVGLNEYNDLHNGFGQALKGFQNDLGPDVGNRPIESWDRAEVHYKSMGNLKTIGDAYHACLTRGYNAGADHLLTRGHISADEHRAMREMYDKNMGGYMEAMDSEVSARDLDKAGISYIAMKSVSGYAGRDSATVADETSAFLDSAQALIDGASALKTRFTSIKSTRESSGKSFGPKARGHVEELVTRLVLTADAFKALIGDSPEIEQAKALHAKTEEFLNSLA